MRAAVVAGVVAALLVTSCGGGGGKSASPATTPATTAPSGAASTAPGPAAACTPVPPRGQPVRWLPADLPMPKGTYTVEELPANGSLKRARLVVPLPLQDFVKFVLAEYPKAGWRLGRGDAEDGFSRGNAGGAWRVRSSFCDQQQSELFLTFVDDVKAANTPFTSAPSSTGSTLAP
jgi:hypothetical protein